MEINLDAPSSQQQTREQQSWCGGNRGVMMTAQMLTEKRIPFALALVVSTQGSTYRKAGALALIALDGTTRSVISGGCLEPTLHDAAIKAMHSEEPQSLTLDTVSDDDLIFGSGSGCRGTMRILVIPVNGDNPHTLYRALADSHTHYWRLKLALIIDQQCCAQGMAWSANQSWQIGERATQFEKNHAMSFGEHSMTLKDLTQVTVAVLETQPARKIALIGASVETPYIIRFTHTLGWHITVIDHRLAQLATHAAEADATVCSKPTAAFSAIDNDVFDAALIMSHSATIDLEALHALALRNESYVGLLGPLARRDELLQQLTSSDRDCLQSRLHAPLGLKLGGDGPEPLALSVTAELQRFFHNE